MHVLKEKNNKTQSHPALCQTFTGMSAMFSNRRTWESSRCLWPLLLFFRHRTFFLETAFGLSQFDTVCHSRCRCLMVLKLLRITCQWQPFIYTENKNGLQWGQCFWWTVPTARLPGSRRIVKGWNSWCWSADYPGFLEALCTQTAS